MSTAPEPAHLPYRPGQPGRPPLSGRVDRLLAKLAERESGIRHALVVSIDGRPLGATPSLSNQELERLAAVTIGLVKLGAGTSRFFSGGVLGRSVIEMQHLHLAVTAIRGGACLTVLADAGCDTAQLSYQMAVLADELAVALAAPTRRSRWAPRGEQGGSPGW